MGRIAVIILVLLTWQCRAQQRGFLNANGIKVMALPADMYYIFETPGLFTTYTCYPEDLDSAAYYDMSKLENLEILHIQFALDPDTTNRGKQLFIDTLIQHLQALKYFAACPKLKKIMLGVGEQIFITRSQVEQCNEDYDQMEKMNLENAWKKLGPLMQRVLPGKKLYAYNWGW